MLTRSTPPQLGNSLVRASPEQPEAKHHPSEDATTGSTLPMVTVDAGEGNSLMVCLTGAGQQASYDSC